jgi:hypothetical protein
LAEEAHAELDGACGFLVAGKALPSILVFYERDLGLRSVIGLDFETAEDKAAAIDPAGVRAGQGL